MSRFSTVTTLPSMSPPGLDEVDALVDAWSIQRPDLDISPLEILSRVNRLSRRLDLARRDAFRAHDLELWEFDVLAALRRAGVPYELSPGQLLKETLVSSGTMTNRIDRLSDRGLVERLPAPHDRRGVIVKLTSQGRDVVDHAFAALLHEERVLISGLDDGQRTALADLLRQLLLRYSS
jgi:DNA-binding MarR family transcriptional regulator